MKLILARSEMTRTEIRSNVLQKTTFLLLFFKRLVVVRGKCKKARNITYISILGLKTLFRLFAEVRSFYNELIGNSDVFEREGKIV